MKEEYFCFNTDCIVYQAKQEAQKSNRQDLLDSFNRRLCKSCKEKEEKPIIYCGLCEKIFCVINASGGRNLVQNTSVLPMKKTIEECQIRGVIKNEK